MSYKIKVINYTIMQNNKNNVLNIAKQQLSDYEKQLFYLLATGNTLQEFCIRAKLENTDNKNDIEKLKLKKLSARIQKITMVLESLSKHC